MFESPGDLAKRQIKTVGYHAMRGLKTDDCFFLQDVQVMACVAFLCWELCILYIDLNNTLYVAYVLSLQF